MDMEFHQAQESDANSELLFSNMNMKAKAGLTEASVETPYSSDSHLDSVITISNEDGCFPKSTKPPLCFYEVMNGKYCIICNSLFFLNVDDKIEQGNSIGRELPDPTKEAFYRAFKIPEEFPLDPNSFCNMCIKDIAKLSQLQSVWNMIGWKIRNLHHKIAKDIFRTYSATTEVGNNYTVKEHIFKAWYRMFSNTEETSNLFREDFQRQNNSSVASDDSTGSGQSDLETETMILLTPDQLHFRNFEIIEPIPTEEIVLNTFGTTDMEMGLKQEYMTSEDSTLNNQNACDMHSNVTSSNQPKHVQMLFTCKLCSQDFSSKSALDDHLEKLHPDSRHLRCRLCNKNFRREWTLKRHKQIFHQDIFLINSNEDVGADAQITCQPSQRSSKRRSPWYNCPICEKRILGKDRLIGHLQEGQCFKNLTRKTTRRNTSITITAQATNPSSFSCRKCNLFFSSEDYLRVHQRIHDRVVTTPHLCTKCNRCFQSSQNLKIHTISCVCQNKDPSLTTAMKTPTTFTQTKQMNVFELDSLNTSRKGQMSRTPRCPFCGKIFLLKTSMLAHMKSHNLDRVVDELVLQPSVN